MKKLIFLFLLFSCAYSQNESLKISEWKNYASLLSINALTAQENDIWGATNGGIFRCDQTTRKIEKYTNVEGLSSLEISSIFADSKKRIWIGNSNGKVDIFDVTGNQWLHVEDISLAYSGTSKKINGFFQKNDSIYILSDFGISVYDIDKKEFRDTYIKFGNFAAFTKVMNLKITGNRIFAETPSGIAAGNKDSKNLLSPDEWVNYDKDKYFESQTPVDIESFNNVLYVLTEFGLFKENGNTFKKISALDQSSKKLVPAGNSLYIIQTNKILLLNSTDVITETAIPISKNLSSGCYTNNKLWVSLEGNGIAVINNNKPESIEMNCPLSNNFSNMIVSSTGALWATSSGIGGSAAYGFYKFQDGIWTNYNKASNPELGSSDAFCALAEGNDGAIYLGSWGGGVVKVLNDKITHYNQQNSTLVGINGAENFVTISAIAKDVSGTIWFANYIAVNNKALSSLSSASKWTAYQNGINLNSIYFARGLTVDEYGTKWIISSEYDPVYKGLFYFNDKYTLPNTIGGWGFISNEVIFPGGTNPQVQCIALDKNNELWVGTLAGIGVINTISDPLKSISKPCNTTRCNINGQIINCITIDPLNNKWVGTKGTGIWVLTPDGSSVITQLNTANSKLPDDNITSIIINQQNGTVYIGTEKGLATFKTFLVEPLPEFSNNLKVYPNPYNPEKGTLSIDGLIESSSIKIITPYGKMIKDFPSPGGRVAYWDGLDSGNKMVSSGVYFVIAYSSDGNKSSIGKVAVVRSNK